MTQFWLCLFSALGGGMIGYATNDIAVNMLFRKYGRFGAVIRERYAEFIENISALVEEDLVNSGTLGPEFDRTEFKDIIHSLTEAVLSEKLPLRSGGVSLAEIPGFTDTAETLSQELRGIERDVIEKLYAILAEKTIGDIVSRRQFDYALDAWITSLVDTEGRDDLNGSGLRELFGAAFAGKTIQTLFSDTALCRVSENLRVLVRDADFSRLDAALDKAFAALLASQECDALLAALGKTLGDIRPADFIHDPELVSRSLAARLAAFVDSQDGRRLLSALFDAFLRDARNIDLKIAELVNPFVFEKITRFIKEKSPPIFDRIIAYIQKQQDEIERIVNKTVEQELESSPGGMVLKFVTDAVTDNIAGRFGVISKITAYIKEAGDGAGAKLADQITGYVQDHSIGDIIAALFDGNSGLVRQQGREAEKEKLIDFLCAKIRDMALAQFSASSSDGNSFIEGLLRNKLSASFAVDLSVLKEALLPALFEKLKRAYLLNKPDLIAALDNGFRGAVEKDLSNLVTHTRLNASGSAKTLKEILRGLWPSISGLRLKDVLGGGLPENCRVDWDAVLRKAGTAKLVNICGALQNERSYMVIAEGVVNLAKENLGGILKGGVANIVQRELWPLGPDKINGMVKDFMASDLRPLNYFGAGLGFLVGFLAAFFAPGIENVFLRTGVFLCSGALTGILTNFIAIKMLFHPYRSLFGIKKRIFTGVIPLRQPIFAEKLSHLIKNTMLSERALRSLFTEKEALNTAIRKRVSASASRPLENVLRDSEKRAEAADFLLHFAHSYALEHHADLTAFVEHAAKNAVESGALREAAPGIRDAIVSRIREMGAPLVAFVQKAIQGKKFGDYPLLPSLTLDFLTQQALVAGCDFLAVDRIEKLLRSHDRTIAAVLEKYSLEDLVGKDVLEAAAARLAERSPLLLQKGAAILVDYLVKQEFNSSQKLSTLFGGFAFRSLKKNISWIVAQAVALIQKSRKRVKQEIDEAIREEAGLFGGLASWATEEHVSNIVDALLDTELPLFLAAREDDLLRIAASLLDYPLSSLGFTEETFKKEEVEKAVAGVLLSPALTRSAEYAAASLVRQSAALPLKTFLALFAINTTEDLLRVFSPLLQTFCATGKSEIEKLCGNTEAAFRFRKDVQEPFLPFIAALRFERVFGGIDFEAELRPALSTLLDDKRLLGAFSQFLDAQITSVLSRPAFYNAQTLLADLDHFFHTALTDDWEALYDALKPCVETLLHKAPATLAPQAWEALQCDYLVPAVLDACEERLGDILAVINIQDVIEREVKGMRPEKIEKMFYKFAGGYFRRITLYGWIGIFNALLFAYWLFDTLKGAVPKAGTRPESTEKPET